jgi:hypothetical protein
MKKGLLLVLAGLLLAAAPSATFAQKAKGKKAAAKPAATQTSRNFVGDAFSQWLVPGQSIAKAAAPAPAKAKKAKRSKKAKAKKPRRSKKKS